MLPAWDEYCLLIANLPNQFPAIRSSTLKAYTIGPYVAEVEGQLVFEGGYVLDVWELLDLSTRAIRGYSYELTQASERIWWYDPTEHPGDPTLAATYPHHKHVPPDIKHRRVPAPGLAFTEPNLLLLVREVEQLLNQP